MKTQSCWRRSVGFALLPIWVLTAGEPPVIGQGSADDSATVSVSRFRVSWCRLGNHWRCEGCASDAPRIRYLELLLGSQKSL
jgi:hypothetical protein